MKIMKNEDIAYIEVNHSVMPTPNARVQVDMQVGELNVAEPIMPSTEHQIHLVEWIRRWFPCGGCSFGGC